MNYNNLLINSFGINCTALSEHSELLNIGASINPDTILWALKGIANYPLSNKQKQHLRNRLLALSAISPSLWRVNRPTIALYRFPNKELRYFLLSANGHLFEDRSAEQFFPCIPVLSKQENTQWMLSGNGRSIKASQLHLCWMPQNSNFSHFLCDYLAPCIDSSLWSNTHTARQVLVCEQWQPWQKHFLKRLDLNYIHVPSPYPGELIFIEPASVIVPIVPTSIQSQLILRNWLHQTITSALPSYELPKIPILITRSGHKKDRIRNLTQLNNLVQDYGGVSINPNMLSMESRLLLFRQASTIIGDGSSSMNAILFGSADCRYIGLSDPESIMNSLYLDGGWPYTHFIASRSSFIVGEEAHVLPGSTLGSSTYCCQLVEKAIRSAQAHSQ